MIGLACSTLSCDGFVDSGFVRTFEVAPRVGFRFVELNCWHPADYTPARIERIKAMSAETGLRPIAVYGSSFGGSNNHELSKDVCHKLRMIDMAGELGCRRVVATGGRRGTQGGLEAIITVLREIAPVAEERGILVCLENHANNNLQDIADYEHLFKAI